MHIEFYNIIWIFLTTTICICSLHMDEVNFVNSSITKLRGVYCGTYCINIKFWHQAQAYV